VKWEDILHSEQNCCNATLRAWLACKSPKPDMELRTWLLQKLQAQAQMRHRTRKVLYDMLD